MAHEEWRDVVGYEGLYQVSNLGNVRSLTREVSFGNRTRVVHGKVLKRTVGAYGYYVVGLSDGQRRRIGKVHRLVAEMFIPNPNNLPAVDHINCIKTDNRVENLRWCTIAQNTQWARENGLMKPMSQEHRQALINRTARPVIRDDGKRYPSVKAAAEDMGVTDNAVHAVLHGRYGRHTCGGHTFKYEDENVNVPKGERRKARRVLQIDASSGKIVNVFENSLVAMEVTGNTSITHCLRGFQKSSRGFIYQYEHDTCK